MKAVLISEYTREDRRGCLLNLASIIFRGGIGWWRHDELAPVAPAFSQASRRQQSRARVLVGAGGVFDLARGRRFQKRFGLAPPHHRSRDSGGHGSRCLQEP